MKFTPTVDPDIGIEEQREGYILYRRFSTGDRWEVQGVCDKRGNCLVGAVIEGETITTIERARELAEAYTGPDVPVTEGFKGCCPLTVVKRRKGKAIR
jgi:hypothetical protein